MRQKRNGRPAAPASEITQIQQRSEDILSAHRFQPAQAAALFDYAALPGEVVTDLKAGASRIRALTERISRNVISVGLELSKAKATLDHGQFGAWLAAEFIMTERTAQNYMRVAEQFGDKSETVSVLQPSAPYLLASPSTPTVVKNAVVENLQRGDVPSGGKALAIDLDLGRAQVVEPAEPAEEPQQ